MLTLHVRSRVFPQLEDAAQFIKAIIGLYDVFMDNKRIKAAQAVANLVELDSTAAAAVVVAEAAALEADVQVSFVICVTAIAYSCWATSTICLRQVFVHAEYSTGSLLAGLDSCRYCSQAAQHNQD